MFQEGIILDEFGIFPVYFVYKILVNSNGPSNKFIFRATYGNSIVCNIFPA
jgi:hypothetical protein